MTMKPLAAICAILACAYLAICSFLYLRQRALLYYPTPPVQADARAIKLVSDDAMLRLWQVGPDDREAPAVIYFGGNGEQVAANLPALPRTLPGQSIYLLNYRGYGGSSGSPSEPALLADALNVYDYVHERHAQVSLVGRSLGSGVAMHVATRRNPARMVLVTPYDSIVRVAQGYYPYIPVSVLLKDRFDSVSRAPQVAAPTLVLVAGEDEVIPRERSEALIEKLPPGLVRVQEFPKAGHNDISELPEYWQALGRFLARGENPL